MPELVELGPKLKQENVRLMAVSVDLALPQKVDSVEKLAAFVERREIALPVLAFRGDFDALVDAHGWPGGVPFTVLFGPEGELGRIEGAAEDAAIRALIAAARRR